mmetsp:Transcript_12584/g.18871  ORF Transcript_12584/g.18871 Transcript_12584/m.18871 type:complete len:159 (+) Transcript_12584:355-831(+)
MVSCCGSSSTIKVEETTRKKSNNKKEKLDLLTEFECFPELSQQFPIVIEGGLVTNLSITIKWSSHSDSTSNKGRDVLLQLFDYSDYKNPLPFYKAEQYQIAKGSAETPLTCSQLSKGRYILMCQLFSEANDQQRIIFTITASTSNSSTLLYSLPPLNI